MYKIDGRVLIEDVVADWEPPLAEFVAASLAADPTGHDIYHCLRVKRLALQVATGEGLDQDVMVASAYLHDVGRERERRQEGDHVQIGMAAAREILPATSFPAEKIDAVVRCIEYHEEYEWARTRQAVSAEADREILGFQDADRLDAIGAIGIARMFSFGGAYQRPLWIPETGPGFWQHGELGSSTYNHLAEKLLKLKDTMNTTTGRELAAPRHCFMERFVEEFEREWHGT